MGEPTRIQMAEGARLALNNSRDLLIAAKASSPAIGAALVTLAEEEIGKAFLIAEAVDPCCDGNGASWASCKRSFRDHRAKLIAYRRWTDTACLGPDPGLYCDTEDGVIPEHDPMPDAELADLGHQLLLLCQLYTATATGVAPKSACTTSPPVAFSARIIVLNRFLAIIRFKHRSASL